MFLLWVVFGLVTCGMASAGGIQDFGLAKAQLYFQEGPGMPEPAETGGFLFVASFEIDDPSRSASGTLQLPNGETHQFVRLFTNTNLFHTRIFDTENELHAAYPNGTYTFSLTVDGVTHTASIDLVSTPFPSGPHITNYTELQEVDPTESFAVEWAPIPEGTADDLILVEIGDYESPKFGEPGYLIGTDTSFVVEPGGIDANTVSEGTVYFSGIVNVNTTSIPGALGVGIVGAWTMFDVVASGEADDFRITTESLPNATLEQPYSATFQASAPVIGWTVGDPSALPSGLSLDAMTGELSGTPSESGSFAFEVMAVSMTAELYSRGFVLNVLGDDLLPAVPVTSGASFQNGTFSLVIESPEGDEVRVEVSSNLKTWTVYGTFTPENGVVEFEDSDAGSADARFYRVSWE